MADFLIKNLILILCIDLMLFLGQVAMNKTAEDIGKAPMVFYSLQNSSIAKAGNVNTFTLDTSNPQDKLITTQPTLDTSGGGWFSDIVKDIKNWFVSNIPGFNYLSMFFSAPASFLAAVGAPQEITFSLGAIWIIYSLIVLIMFITGR